VECWREGHDAEDDEDEGVLHTSDGVFEEEQQLELLWLAAGVLDCNVERMLRSASASLSSTPPLHV